MVTGAAVGVATMAVGVAVYGAILVGKGAYKTGEVVLEAVKGEDEKQRRSMSSASSITY